MRLLQFFILVLIISSCSFLVEPEVTFIIKNETSKDLTISTFSKSVLINDVQIKNNEDYISKKKYREGGDGDVSPFHRDVDSLVIAFPDGKVLIHYCSGEKLYRVSEDPACQPVINIMNFYTGDFEMGKRKKSTRTIVVDRSDYDQAVLP